MNDQEFLIWIHDRLELLHHENPNVDYMHKLRAIITSIDPDTDTPNDGRGKNSIESLLESLGLNS